MCGLAGILTTDANVRAGLAGSVGRMAATLVHRGPDDAGVWASPEEGVAFGFRRLAIVDLSPNGHQPMHSASGRYVVAFNGEVYNYRELATVLGARGHRFTGHSDTEVLLAAVEEWGVQGAVERFTGMFAIALWDRVERTLHLVRDRVGIKPLFVYARPGLVAFASELKALVAAPGFDATVDGGALTAYFRYLYVPAPRSIFRGVRKLEPGHVLTVADPRPAELPAARPFWSAEEAARAGLAHPCRLADDEMLGEAERLLTDAVALRMRADVPVGAFLSGGIDSSLVTALMQRCSPTPVKTFTIGFTESAYDESEPARRVARHLGTDHTEVVLSASDALAQVPALPELFDEPLADPSEIPTALVCRVARRRVTVALSGDGGDELFAGYNRYLAGERMLRSAVRVPAPVRQLAAAGLGAVSPDRWDRISAGLSPALPRRLRTRLPGDKLHKVAALLRVGSTPEMYRSLLSAWQDPALLVKGGTESVDTVERVLRDRTPPQLLERMMLADQLTYLVDDLLAKVDRASMGVALEVRVPLLDHRVVEFAWTLPRRARVRDGQGKWLLRALLYRHVPRPLVDRQKVGFSVPIDAWLRGPLREWGGDLLTVPALERTGVLRPEPIRRAWSRFQQGHGRAGLALWAVLMFQSWFERWGR